MADRYVNRIVYGSSGETRVYLDNGEELGGVFELKTSTAVDDFTKAEIHCYVNAHGKVSDSVMTAEEVRRLMAGGEPECP